MVKDADTIEKSLPKTYQNFQEKDCVIVAHNANFDVGFFKTKCKSTRI